MRYFIILLLLPLCAFPAQARLHVALVEAGGDQGVPNDVSSYARTGLEEELNKSGKFVLVERSRVQAVVEEIAFQQSGVTDPGTAAQLGRQLNVDKLIFVQTHRVYPRYELTLRIVDVATGQVLRVEKESLGRQPPEIRAAVRRLARRLIAISSLLSPAEMVLIPAGTLLMGSDQGLGDERPPHRVSMSAFYLDPYEVRRIAFQEFLVAQGRKKSPDLKDPDLPATMVSWHDAAAFCQAQGRRLPTEAEWEYAARGGEARIFPWGNEPPDPSRARFESRGPLPVDALSPGATPEGLLNLAGNVAEWVQDWWHLGYYAVSPSADPPGPAEGDYRVVRGGSWNQSAEELRAAARAYHNPERGAGHIGFRCARDAPP